MAVNYVKFMRGDYAAYQALKEAGNLDDNTLYFIYGTDNATAGSLYMGERVISGGDVIVENSTLKDLEDVIIEATKENSFLVQNADGNWNNMSVEDVAALIKGHLGDIDFKLTVDTNVFELDENDTLKLSGFENAEAGSHFVKDENGKVSWVKPDNSTVETLETKVNDLETSIGEVETDIADLDTSVAGLTTSVTTLQSNVETINVTLENKANKSSVYTKEETDLSIAAAVAGSAHLKRKIVGSVAEIDKDAEDALDYIYMVSTGIVEDDDKYDEYLVIDFDSVRYVEKVGSWEVDLSDYAKTADIQDSLLSEDDKAKLEKLVIAEDGSVGISGTINASNVKELDTWIAENGATHIRNITDANLSNDLLVRIDYITSVEDTQLKVEDGKLSIISIDGKTISNLSNNEDFNTVKILGETNAGKIVELETLTAQHTTVIAEHGIAISDIQTNLSTNVVLRTEFEKEIGEIKDILTWKDM